MRWDSDHVVLFNDDLRNVFHELVRGRALDRAILALDYFDASINRVTAYVIGTRAVRKAMLYALLEPFKELQRIELEGRLAEKLALLEELKTLPFGDVWSELCCRADRSGDRSWIDQAEKYYRAAICRRT
jgi:L-rhamnose isomerase